MKSKKASNLSALHFAIIGDPVAHSLSPHMHEAAFRALKLPHRYLRIPLTAKQLPSFFKNLRKDSSFQGLNVTIPHKERVLKYLDEISEDAVKIGAVNTILNVNGVLKGFNTDGAGYLCSLKKETGFRLVGKNIVILGAGGAARSILFALAHARAKSITLANRSLARAQKLVKEFQAYFPKAELKAVPLDSSTLEKIFPTTQLLINTTSVGLHGEAFEGLPLDALSKSSIVSDIVYNPKWTPLLKDAKKQKLKIHFGLGMLLYQGALAFEIWTQKKAPIDIMRRALIRNLPK